MDELTQSQRPPTMVVVDEAAGLLGSAPAVNFSAAATLLGDLISQLRAAHARPGASRRPPRRGGPAMTGERHPAELLAQQLAPAAASTAAEFAARWWTAYLYAPIPRRGRRRLSEIDTVAALAAVSPDTRLERGWITAEQIHAYAAEAASNTQAAMDAWRGRGDIHIVSDYNGPWLHIEGTPLGRFATVPAEADDILLFPGHVDMRVTSTLVTVHRRLQPEPVALWPAAHLAASEDGAMP
ncbi:hypothetical protein C8D87_1146 [Lentzea atacamensis]|uniref:Uncharacterized protein n=1 Tax=Lentzea atacamensis TaxID=531938 RepID=A0ABX9DVR6_9PSEU|nr:hypothetical protein [Lentzea atacamensis]RAS59394.1 hypothetical protein C8D87_1146 [Lentzea atacamensis]